MIYKDFKTIVCIGDDSYDNKPKDNDPRLGKAKFRNTEVDIDTLYDRIINGHSTDIIFSSPLNKTIPSNCLSKKNLYATPYIAIDIDKAPITLKELEKIDLKYKPTLAYTTFHNNIDGNRFRLIYVLQQAIDVIKDNNLYCMVYNTIADDIISKIPNISDSIDKCTKGFSGQQLFGTNKNNPNFYGYKTYDILDLNDIPDILFFDDKVIDRYKEVEKDLVLITDNKENVFTKEDYNMLSHLRYDEIIYRFSSSYRLWENNMEKFEDDVIPFKDYIWVWHPFRSKNGRFVKRLYNANKQPGMIGRKDFIKYTIKTIILIIKDMGLEVDKYELMYNAVWYYATFCSNKDEPVSVRKLMEIVSQAIYSKYTSDDFHRYKMNYWQRKNKKPKLFYVNHYKLNGRKSNVVLADYRRNLVLNNADKTITEISRITGYAEDTIKNILYKNKKKVINNKKENKMEMVRRLYNPSLSNRENARVIGVSESYIRKILKLGAHF